MSKLWKLWDRASKAFEVYQLGGWLLSLSGGVGALTAYMAFDAELQWHLILFFGAGAAFFTAGTFAIVRTQIRNSDISEAIRLVDLNPIKFQHIQSNNSVSVDMTAFLINDSGVPVFAKVEYGNLIIEGRASQNFQLGNSIIKIKPGDRAVLVLPTIEQISDGLQSYKGRLQLKSRFGKTEDNLDRYYETEGMFEFIARDSGDGTVNITINTQVPVTKYGRV